jgi:hypothetical protein
MRIAFTIATAFMAVALRAADEQPTPPPTLLDFKTGVRSSISLATKETASRRAITRNWKTNYGSYDRDFARGKSIAIDLVNLGRVEATADTHLDVFWFSQKLADKRVGVFHRETLPVSLGAAKARQVVVEMPTLESSVLNLAALRERYVSGSKVLGWAVVLRTGEKVITFRGSNPSVEAVVRDGAKLSSMLEELAKASEGAVRTRVPARAP